LIVFLHRNLKLSLYLRPESPEKHRRLAKLSSDFVDVAATFGQLIISELYLSDSKKTLRLMGLGGQAGGRLEKFKKM
jgi:hypothetical protein